MPHDAIVPKADKEEVYRKGAWVSQVVTRGGRVVGVWTHETKPKSTKVDVKLFAKKAASKRELRAALTPYEPFIGEAMSLTIA